jgi:hypothetical protein
MAALHQVSSVVASADIALDHPQLMPAGPTGIAAKNRAGSFLTATSCGNCW